MKLSFIQRHRILFNSSLSCLLNTALGIKHKQLVICGYPRSGTSLLYNMISSTLPGFKFESFENYYIYRIHRVGNIATKAPMDIFHVRDIDSYNTNKKKMIILVLIRDIRDIITSKHPMIPNEFFIGHDHSWWPQDPSFEEWKYDAPGVIDIYKEINAIKSRPDVHLVRYEELVNAPHTVQSTISSKYDLHFSGPFIEYHKSADKHAYKYEGRTAPKDHSLVREGKKITQDRVSKWLRDPALKDRVRNQFNECEELFDILIDYGYETDRDWINKI